MRMMPEDSIVKGTLFACWLFATEGLAATTVEDRGAFAETMQEFGMVGSPDCGPTYRLDKVLPLQLPLFLSPQGLQIRRFQ